MHSSKRNERSRRRGERSQLQKEEEENDHLPPLYRSFTLDRVLEEELDRAAARRRRIRRKRSARKSEGEGGDRFIHILFFFFKIFFFFFLILIGPPTDLSRCCLRIEACSELDRVMDERNVSPNPEAPVRYSWACANDGTSATIASLENLCGDGTNAGEFSTWRVPLEQVPRIGEDNELGFRPEPSSLAAVAVEEGRSDPAPTSRSCNCDPASSSSSGEPPAENDASKMPAEST